MSRVLLSTLLAALGFIFAALNIQSQREHISVNRTGIEVTGRVAFKLQEFRSSGRGSSRVNTFRVYYFDEPPESEREPVVLKAFGKEIVLGKGSPYIGNFHAYDIEGIPDALFQRTEEGSRLPLLYLPGNPEKVWLKSNVEGKTGIDPTVPGVFALSGIFLAGAIAVDWPSHWTSFRRRIESSGSDPVNPNSSHSGASNVLQQRETRNGELPSEALNITLDETSLRVKYALHNPDPAHPEKAHLLALFGGTEEACGIKVTDHFEHGQAYYTLFVLLPGREEEAVRALVVLMDVGHEFCFSEGARDRYRYIRRNADGYSLKRSDLSASGDWKRASQSEVIQWLMAVADQNLSMINGRSPATYKLSVDSL